MFKILQANKDTYITNRVINGVKQVKGNVGQAGTLDLYKLYAATYSGSTPNQELSRLLLHFDISDIKNLASNGMIDVNDASFFCRLKLFDVYGGQTCPTNFNVSVFPLSRSFDEGNGRDVVFYQDVDAANFLSSSASTLWISQGAAQNGSSTDVCDYITDTVIGGNTINLTSGQFFTSGEEDLFVDVTQIISASIIENIPTAGFRVSFSSAEENDENSYFVKRFASRHAYDKSKRPQLVVGYDDSFQDETQLIIPNRPSTVYLKNYDESGNLANLSLAGNDLTGSNCLALTLSSSLQNFQFSGSQVTKNGINVTGTYYSTVILENLSSSIKNKLVGGTVKFKPYWTNPAVDTIFYVGEDFYIKNSNATTNELLNRSLIVNAIPERESTLSAEKMNHIRVNIFDNSLRTNVLVKTSIQSHNAVFKNSYYRIVNANTKNVIVAFDPAKGSTRLSSDSNGMYFNLDPSTLIKNENYYIDVMIVINGQEKIYEKVSNILKAI